MRGNWGCHFSDYSAQLAMIRDGLPITDLVTAKFPIEEAPEAYRRFMGELEGKVMLIQ